MSDLKDLEKRMEKDPQESNSHALMKFLIGIVLVALGVFLVFQNTDVVANWYSWRIGSWGVPSGVVVVPLLIGIGILFYNYKSIIGWIVAAIGAAFLIVTLILSVRIVFQRTSLFTYILMFGCIASGCGLMLRALFHRKD